MGVKLADKKKRKGATGDGIRRRVAEAKRREVISSEQRVSR